MKVSFLALSLAVSLSLVVSDVGADDAFHIDAVHSSVLFRIKHMNVSYAYGRFNKISGKFSINETDPGKSFLELDIDVETIDTANEARDRHLKGPDFFNAKQFPSISFRSKSVRKVSTGYTVSGDLTLHGVTKPVDLDLTVVGTGKGMKGETISGLEGSLNLKRSDFGMTYMVGPIGDEVRVSASVEGSHP
ncbi:YceI family protein [Tundrisphaera lichenicola]|uniref:YceI family protein n=1 Tax=Tundrisphaera lichenicola TaxID=2029860 RepID=UPI003EBC1939